MAQQRARATARVPRQTSALNQSLGSAARRVKGWDQMPPRCVTSPPNARARSLVPLCCRWTTTDPKPRRRDPPLVPNPHFYTRAPRHACKKSINGGAWSAPWRMQADTHTPNAKFKVLFWLNYQEKNSETQKHICSHPLKVIKGGERERERLEIVSI